jgi:predicted transcriptional regulator
MRPEQLKQDRAALGLSQSRLARLSQLPRFKIVFFELGDRPLSEEDRVRVRTALRAEARRLAGMATEIGRELAAES